MPDRPSVSVVMPFAGSGDEAAEAISALQRIRLGERDELILVDNNPEPFVGAEPEAVQVLRAPRERSSYFARNTGAAAATNEWLLFLDADCLPAPDIIDAYFASPPGERDGAIAGDVDADSGQDALLARYARSRGYLNQRALLDDPFRPHAVTANLLVRRRAWESVGGFAQGIRSGGDSDFCWRLQEAGWRIGHRPGARAVHRHRETLRAFLRVAARYAAGRAWLRRRHPGAFANRPGVASPPRGLAAAARWLLSGRFERGAFRALDAAVAVADLLGEQRDNRAPAATPSGPADVIVIVDSFPALSETFVASEAFALQRAGYTVRVEAARRPLRQELGALSAGGAAPTRYAEDDSRQEKLVAGLWLVSRHPLGCLRDLVIRRRWRRDEEVLPLRAVAPLARRLAAEPAAKLHCHFATGAALTTMRVSLLIQRPYGLTAHAYDIFRDVRNLPEKLERADLVFTGCRYNVEYLRRLVPASHHDRIHEIVMGVDADVFRRDTPHPGARKVIGVGRLVEKKGFADLIEAVALLGDGQVDELMLVGDGPLRSELEALAHRLGVGGRVRLLGAVEHRQVRALLELADVLAMPCVVAADGDRDSMPVVVKEALALELQVVATDEVGLPELVRPPWGRLVPAHDPAALAAALSELLALGIDERIAQGQAGRAHVIEHCNVDREAGKLISLLGLGPGRPG